VTTAPGGRARQGPREAILRQLPPASGLRRARVLVQVRRTVLIFGALMLITGLAYPLLVTGVAQLAFPHQADGSMLERGGDVVGSELIGQPFSSPRYFWGRPSATPGFPYNASLSAGSNLGPSNPALSQAVEERIASLRAVDPGNDAPVPADLVTASASGLDPHVSVAAALYQVPRVARERSLNASIVEDLVLAHVEGRDLGFLGEPRVNVLVLNLAIDDLSSGGSAPPAGTAPSEAALAGGLPLDGWAQSAVIIVALLVAAVPAGLFLAAVLRGDQGRWSRWVNRPADRLLRLAGIREPEEMDWRAYALCLLMFNAVGIAVVMAIEMLQGSLPLNPQHLPSLRLDGAFNTAVSFGTNTNWQWYAGEATMSYLTQMLALTVQNFLSAATGLAVMAAFFRGISRKRTWELGNFWADIVRSTLVLLPLSFALALVLVSQGVPQTLAGPADVPLLDPARAADGSVVAVQTIPLGPVASQEAIKELGTNGGGFFNANSAHPYENPTPLTNALEIVALLLLPAAGCVAFGQWVKDRRQGYAILAAMVVLFVLFLAVCTWAELQGNPRLDALGVDQVPSATNIGCNMEGKEVRFGIGASTFFASATTGTSCGAVNSMHDSYTPLGGMVPLLLMQLGEVVFGGVGTGLTGMLVFVLIAQFMAGLMIGRMPEYLGKKLGAEEMRLSIALFLLPAVTLLVGTAWAAMSPEGRAGVLNPGPHGFTEILYAYSSCANNNGSAFAGLTVSTPFYNWTLAAAMLVGRYGLCVLTLVLAATLGVRRTASPSPGSLPTHTATFVLWVDFNIMLLGALTFFAALALGPIAEMLMG